jgi:tetratricopeptide (TPR) repeat protein
MIGGTMAHYRCDQCATIVVTEELPKRCESCGAEADVAYPHGSAAQELHSDSVEFMFDLGVASGEIITEDVAPGDATEEPTNDDEAKDDEANDDEANDDEANDDEANDDEANDDEANDDEAKDDEDEAKDDEAKDDEANDDEANDDEAKDDEAKDDDGPWNPAARTTLELDEADLEESSPPPPPSTPAESSSDVDGGAWNPLSRTTLELEEEDLEIQSAGRPTAPPPAPLEGRVAYPVSSNDEEVPASALPDVDDVAVAGLPPTPPRSAEPQASQTESLAKIRGRKRNRRWRGLLLVVAAGGVVGGVAGLMSRSHDGLPPASYLDAGAVSLDAADPVDAALPDQAAADHGADKALDTARVDQTSSSDQTVVLDQTRRPLHVAVKPEPRPRPRPRPKPKPKPKPKPEPEPEPEPEPVTAGPTAKDLYTEGLRSLFRGQNDQAIVKFNEALKTNRRYSMAFRGLGLAYQKTGRKVMAREAYKRYLMLRPNAPDADTIRAKIKTLD